MPDDLSAVEIYIAADPLAAHRLRLELEARGIQARVVGDLLRGAAGELPWGMATAPAVWVPKDDAVRARQIALEWEANERSRVVRPRPDLVICSTCGESYGDDENGCPRCTNQNSEPAASGSTLSRASDFTPLFENRRILIVGALVLLPVIALLIWLAFRAPPRTTEGLFKRGWQRYEAGNYRGAIEDFEQCVFGNSNDVGSYSGIASSYYMLGDLQLALNNYSRALRCDPTISQNYFYRGQCQYFLGHDALAVADYRLALGNASDDFWTLNSLAWLLATSPDASIRNPAEALTMARQSATLDGADPQYAQGTLAAALGANGDYAEALHLIAPLMTDATGEDRRVLLAMQEAFGADRPYIDVVDQRRFVPPSPQLQ